MRNNTSGVFSSICVIASGNAKEIGFHGTTAAMESAGLSRLHRVSTPIAFRAINAREVCIGGVHK